MKFIPLSSKVKEEIVKQVLDGTSALMRKSEYRKLNWIPTYKSFSQALSRTKFELYDSSDFEVETYSDSIEVSWMAYDRDDKSWTLFIRYDFSEFSENHEVIGAVGEDGEDDIVSI